MSKFLLSEGHIKFLCSKDISIFTLCQGYIKLHIFLVHFNNKVTRIHFLGPALQNILWGKLRHIKDTLSTPYFTNIQLMFEHYVTNIQATSIAV